MECIDERVKSREPGADIVRMYQNYFILNTVHIIELLVVLSFTVCYISKLYGMKCHRYFLYGNQPFFIL
jgi:hypothetical protein